MGMTVRELINALLDKRMDAEVLLRTPDPQRHDVVGVNFHIEEYQGRWVTWIEGSPAPLSNVIAWCKPMEPYKGVTT